MADTGASHYKDAKEIIKVWDIVEEKMVKNGRTFASMQMDYVDSKGEKKSGAGFADGIRCDEDGNIWASAGWVGRRLRRRPHLRRRRRHTHWPDQTSGDLLQRLLRRPKRNRLFMTGSTSLYAVYVETKGAHIT